jgi:hypothetical protein
MTDLEVLSNPIDERKAGLKVLRTVARPYKEMAQAIESLLDLKKMTLEELTGRLVIYEDREADKEKAATGGRLLLTEEEWAARSKLGDHGAGSSLGGDWKGKGTTILSSMRVIAAKQTPGKATALPGARESASTVASAGTGQKSVTSGSEKAGEAHIAQAEEAHMAEAPPAMLLIASVVDTTKHALSAHHTPTPCPERARRGKCWHPVHITQSRASHTHSRQQ